MSFRPKSTNISWGEAGPGEKIDEEETQRLHINAFLYIFIDKKNVH